MSVLGCITIHECNHCEKVVTLQRNLPYLPFDYTPKEAGRFEFVAEVEPLAGETVTENNRSARYYSLTRAGRKQLGAQRAQWQKLSRGVDLILSGARS